MYVIIQDELYNFFYKLQQFSKFSCQIGQIRIHYNYSGSALLKCTSWDYCKTFSALLNYFPRKYVCTVILKDELYYFFLIAAIIQIFLSNRSDPDWVQLFRIRHGQKCRIRIHNTETSNLITVLMLVICRRFANVFRAVVFSSVTPVLGFLNNLWGLGTE